jgi:hypothetical protein
MQARWNEHKAHLPYVEAVIAHLQEALHIRGNTKREVQGE